MMKYHRVLLIVSAIFVAAVNGRVYYLQNPESNRYSNTIYPIPDEQSSRDLDLSFSAGDSDEVGNVIPSAKKVYTLMAPEKPSIEVNKEEPPIARYKLVEAPVRRYGLDDVIVVPQEPRHKLVKIDGNNKGEVILELRVLANHNNA